jgi:hypothetical protein
MILTRERKEKWNLLEKTIFKFLFLYFLLYILSIFTAPLWEPIVKWVGTSIFNIQHEFSSNGKGSGDTTYAYLLLFLFFCLSIFGSIFWSLFDSKRKSYNQLQYGFLVFLRFVLIFFMFQYGIIKIFHLQMSPISNSDLIQTFGTKSPMGLAWKFMGFSKTYSIFAGLAEVIAGFLLIFRKTQTFGAIAVIIVMLNVFMMNLCFDIPVKIFSFHLMLMGVILLLADFKRVFGVLLLNKNIDNYIIYPQLKKDDKQVITVAKWVMLILVSALFIFTSYPRYKKKYLAQKTAFYGVWEVIEFNRGNQKNKTYLDLKKRWQYIAIDEPKYASIKTIGDKQSNVKFIIDTTKNTIGLGSIKSKNLDTLNFTHKDSILIINGIFKRDSLKMKLKKKKLNEFNLKSRGYNWINEFPLNN